MLTDFACKNAKPKNKPYRLKDFNNLSLEVRPTGKKVWRFRYTLFEKENVYTIGEYPTVGIAEARAATEDARAQLKQNIDPNDAKRHREHQAQYDHTQTFQLVAKEWFDTYLDTWSEDTAEIIWRRFEIYVFPEVGNDPIASLKRSQMLAVFRKIEKVSHDVSHRIFKHCVKVFTHAKDTDRIEVNPIYDLGDTLKKYKRRHFKAIHIGKLPELLKKLQEQNLRLTRQTALAVRLLMLTAVRTSELIKAKWPEIDLETGLWTIPAERMKMKEEHVVPLSKQALAMFAELKEMNGHREWVFPQKGHYKKHMSEATILRVLERMGYKGQMTGHGFRSVFMGVAKEKLHYKHDVPDRQLAHRPRGTNGSAYDRADFAEERAELMQEYADYIDDPHNYQPHRKSNHERQILNEPSTPFKFKTSVGRVEFQFEHAQSAYQSGPHSTGQEGPRWSYQILERGIDISVQKRTNH